MPSEIYTLTPCAHSLQVHRIHHRIRGGAWWSRYWRQHIMEARHLDSTDVLQHHLVVCNHSPRIPKMALRQQQAGSGKEHADQVPRRRQPGQRMGQASTERIRRIARDGWCRQEMVGLQSIVQDQIHLLSSLLQCFHHNFRPVGW
jgi:hypothetical protein